MLITDLITQILPRAQRLKLVDPVTGFIDRDEIYAYVLNAMRYLANCYQLQHFLRMNRELFRTVASVESYPIPDSYGFWSPEETRYSGLAISNTDGTSIANLEYWDLPRFNNTRSSTTGRPARFTIAESLLYLQPIPDAVYVIEAIIRPVQDGIEVPEPYVAMVAIETIYRMAADQGKVTPMLLDERVQLTRTAVNGESRQRIRFHTSYERVGFGRGRRRYGL